MKKKKILIFVGILLLIVIGLVIFEIVFNNSYKKEVSLNETFKLPIHKTVEVKNENLKIKLISVSDSRCKEGWLCIWQGEIGYKIIINDQEVELGTVKTKSVNYKDYRILLDKENNDLEYVIIKIVKWR